MTYPPPPQQPPAPQQPYAPPSYAPPQSGVAPGYAVPPGYQLTPIPTPRPPRGPSPLQLAAGRQIASAAIMFLGGYLLLQSYFSSNLLDALANVIPLRYTPDRPASFVALTILEFLFAIAVVIAGILIGRGSTAAKAAGSVLVGVGALVSPLFNLFRAYGDLRIPNEIAIPLLSLVGNSWFAVVLLVGLAWLLTRRVGLGWLTLLGTLVLIPLPQVFALNAWEYGASTIVMYLLSGIVGGSILLAGKPLRD